MGDSLALFCQKADATVRLQPGKKNPSMPQVSLSLSADTMFCRAWKTKMGVDRAGFAVTAENCMIHSGFRKASLVSVV